MPDLIATDSYPYDGKNVRKGQRFTATEKDAETLVLIRKATRAPDLAVDAPAAKVMQADPVTATTPPRRNYRRRDMTTTNIASK